MSEKENLNGADAAPFIELSDVTYCYDDTPALAEVNLSVGKGEAVSLMGPNGCGKSTLLKIMNGLIFPEIGKYSFSGSLITKKSMKDTVFEKTLHKRIGFVFQNSDAQLFCASVYDEIAFGPRQMGMPESEIALRAGDLIRLLKLDGMENRAPYHLSGGEKKKVAIACVLVMNPDVLMLDEPMNGLDPKTERWLTGFLKALIRTEKTIVVSTHDLELVQEITDRTVLFGEDHRIAADMPTRELLADTELLRHVGLVDKYYHKHEQTDAEHAHSHFHLHNY